MFLKRIYTYKNKMTFNVKIPIIICVILILYVLIMTEYNKKQLIELIQNSSNAAMSSFAKIIINNL